VRPSADADLDLAAWSGLALSTSDKDARRGAFDRSSLDLPVSDGSLDAVFDRAVRALLRYQIFPPWRMQYRVGTTDGNVAEGATIVQRVTFGPIALETAVRVVSVFDSTSGGERKSGFTYATLRGHPERGLATFYVRHELATASLSVVIETWSRPGVWFTRIGRPVARVLQKRMTREALSHFRAGHRSPVNPSAPERA
jgi:uncharacterized protein (UPF0548 family)